jgi:transposase-like protein
MAKKTNPHCPQCDAELSKKPKTSFWSGHKEYKCEKCGYQGGLPLWTSTRIVYWTITVLVLFRVLPS